MREILTSISDESERKIKSEELKRILNKNIHFIITEKIDEPEHMEPEKEEEIKRAIYESININSSPKAHFSLKAVI